MRILAVAVALFALLAFAVGWNAKDTPLELLGPASLIAAWCCWRSAPISRFLKIFIALFSVETIVFGLADLSARFGYWPKALEEAPIPTTLALTVAIFAIIVFAVSHIPVVRRHDPHRRPLLLRQRHHRRRFRALAPEHAQARPGDRHGGLPGADQSGASGDHGAAQFLQPRFLQRHSGKERSRILADADLGVHALGLRLRGERGDRICHQLLSGHSLAALADALLHQPLAGGSHPLPHVADRRHDRQSRPAHRRGRRPLHRWRRRRRRLRLWRL